MEKELDHSNKLEINFLDYSHLEDPGFPMGGCGLGRGAIDPRGGYILKILHVKMKESGSVGGACARCTPLNLPMGLPLVILKLVMISKQTFG